MQARRAFRIHWRNQTRGNGVGFEFGFYDGLPTIPPDKLETLVWALDINPKGELYRTHWAVKDVDLMPSLVDAGIITAEQAANLPPRLLKAGLRQQAAQLMIAPQVFRVVDPKVEMDLASVMMPFDAQFNPVYVGRFRTPVRGLNFDACEWMISGKIVP